MGYHTVKLTKQQEELLKAYRGRRRVERGGKVLQNNSAIQELIASALEGIELQRVITIEELVARIDKLEAESP